MSFLTPLYILGLLAVSLPLLFHLIRRTPSGRRPFSSLMFLSPSPPRITRRSRLENLLLLLLRAAALTLLALAFARPFLREAASLTLDSVRSRRVAIVLDTSASMRREGAWNQAREEVGRVLDGLERGDEVALFTFGDHTEAVVDFERDRSGVDGPARVRAALETVEPGWGATDVGHALVVAADALRVAKELEQAATASQLVLVSDLQEGSQTRALQAFEWPDGVTATIRAVAPLNRSNANARVLHDPEVGISPELRVKVTNTADSVADQFFVGWDTDEDVADWRTEAAAVYVPPGQSRVVRVPRDAASGRLILRGEDAGFDNTFHLVPVRKQEVTIAYLGNDAPDDPEGLRYYFELALADTFLRKVSVIGVSEFRELAAGDAPQLIVATQPLEANILRSVEQSVQSGSSLLAVTRERDFAVQLAAFNEHVEVMPAAAEREEGGSKGYVMLSDIDFSHPLFAAFAQPQYSNFTKIHFWNHLRMKVHDDEAGKIIARFDDGTPALLEQQMGSGHVWILTSGWDPPHSQLALSTKFVPLLSAIVDRAASITETLPSYQVHDAVELPNSDGNEIEVIRPDGERVKLAGHQRAFSGTELPGLYSVSYGDQTHPFAVNVAPRESDTSRMDVERLEQLGVQFGATTTRSEELARQRQLRDVELEGRQKIWQWLIVVVLGLLGVETVLAGWKRRGPADD